MKNINKEMAKKFLVKEKEVGKMLALLTGLFFLVYLPILILRAVIYIFYSLKKITLFEKDVYCN